VKVGVLQNLVVLKDVLLNRAFLTVLL